MGKITECEFAQRLGSVVKLRLRDESGEFKNHYHRYKTEEKAKIMHKVFSEAIEAGGGTR